MRKYGQMTEVIGGGTGSSVRQGNLTVREKVEGDHKLVPRRSLQQSAKNSLHRPSGISMVRHCRFISHGLADTLISYLFYITGTKLLHFKIVKNLVK